MNRQTFHSTLDNSGTALLNPDVVLESLEKESMCGVQIHVRIADMLRKDNDMYIATVVLGTARVIQHNRGYSAMCHTAQWGIRSSGECAGDGEEHCNAVCSEHSVLAGEHIETQCQTAAAHPHEDSLHLSCHEKHSTHYSSWPPCPMSCTN